MRWQGVALFTFLLLFAFAPSKLNGKRGMDNIDFYFCDEISNFSLSVYDSDVISNLVFMEGLVGTLIKYSHTGRYEPFLADKWLSSDKGQKWAFHLREGLTSEKETLINGKSYVESLTLTLKYLSSKSRVPVFESLIGWDDFSKGVTDKIEGLTTGSNDYWVVFHFKERVFGLMEYLAMPYYGIHDNSDKDLKTGAWIDKNKITSTGPYYIYKKDSVGIVLKKRDDFFSVTGDSPAIISFKNKTYDESLKGGKNSIILKKLSIHDKYPSRFNLVNTTPTNLVSLVISPFRDNNLHRKENRDLLIRMFRIAARDIPFNSLTSIKASSFYASSEKRKNDDPLTNEITKEDRDHIAKNFQDELTLVRSLSISSEEVDYLEKVIFKMKEIFKVSIKIVEEDRTDPDFFSKITSNRFYDLRVSKVDIGGSADEFVIGMMFCSNLGVSFPDPEGRICQLIENQKKGGSREAFEAEFNEIYQEDRVVLPLWHSGPTWLMTKNIDLSTVTGTMGIPRFDTLRILN